jgi:hypothetical protein
MQTEITLGDTVSKCWKKTVLKGRPECYISRIGNKATTLLLPEETQYLNASIRHVWGHAADLQGTLTYGRDLQE